MERMPDHEQVEKKRWWKEYGAEIKFVLIFVIGLSASFFLINTKQFSDAVVEPITVLETTIASKVLQWIGFDNQQKGTVIRGKGGNPFQMEVKNNCNGIYESVIFLLAFTAIQLPWRRKWPWILGGFLVFHAINELRLVSLFIIGSNYSHETFVFFHETFWQYALILFTISLFLFCAHQMKKREGGAKTQ